MRAVVLLGYLNIQVTFVSQVYSKVIMGGKLMLHRLPFSIVKIGWDSVHVYMYNLAALQKEYF